MPNPAPRPSSSTPVARVGAGLHDAVRTRLWPVPVAAVVLAVVLGIAVPLLDARVDESLPGWMTGGVFGGGPSAARDVLAAVAGAVMTVTSLTFSLTVVTLQLASSQFSPRLLRTFTGDAVVQGILGLFLATFVYSLLVLRTVRDAPGDVAVSLSDEVFVPRIAVTVSIALAVVCVLGLVGFLAHLTRQIRVEPVLQAVHREGSATLARTAPGGSAPRLPGPGTAVPARLTGFVTSVDERGLLRLAGEHDVVVDITAGPGSSVLVGAPLGRLHSRDGGPVDGDVADRAAAEVRIGPERTSTEDPTFALRQLLDIALRALSPSTNDPTTAIHALGHVGAMLCELVRAGLGDAVRRDDTDTVRVVLRRPGAVDLLDAVVGQTLRYATTDPAICRELLVLLARVAFTAPDDADLLAQLRVRRTQILDQALDGAGDDARRMLEEAAGQVDDALAGTWNQQPQV